MHQQTGGRTGGQTDGRTGGRADRQMGGRTGGQADGRTGGQTRQDKTRLVLQGRAYFALPGSMCPTLLDKIRGLARYTLLFIASCFYSSVLK